MGEQETSWDSVGFLLLVAIITSQWILAKLPLSV